MIRGVKTNSSKQAGLGLFRATGIYVGAILGSGILVLPAIAAKEAGPTASCRGPSRGAPVRGRCPRPAWDCWG